MVSIIGDSNVSSSHFRKMSYGILHQVSIDNLCWGSLYTFAPVFVRPAALAILSWAVCDVMITSVMTMMMFFIVMKIIMLMRIIDTISAIQRRGTARSSSLSLRIY